MQIPVRSRRVDAFLPFQEGRWLRWGLGRVEVSWHNIERLLGALFLTDWNFANFMNSHEQCNGRCPRDVFSHIPLLVWLIASSDKSYIRIGESVHISAWASTLLVQLDWAMRRPRFVGRVTGRIPRFLFCRGKRILIAIWGFVAKIC